MVNDEEMLDATAMMEQTTSVSRDDVSILPATSGGTPFGCVADSLKVVRRTKLVVAVGNCGYHT